MKEKIIKNIIQKMQSTLNNNQIRKLENILNFELIALFNDMEEEIKTNEELVNLFLDSKKLEGCSENTIKYYVSTINLMLNSLSKSINEIDTNDLRNYLSSYQQKNNSSKVTIDNIRRILSSFFS